VVQENIFSNVLSFERRSLLLKSFFDVNLGAVGEPSYRGSTLSIRSLVSLLVDERIGIFWLGSVF